MLDFFAAKAAQEREPKKHRLLSVAICDRKHANSIPPPKVGLSLVAKRLCHYVGIMNRERSFGSNRRVKVWRGQL